MSETELFNAFRSHIPTLGFPLSYPDLFHALIVPCILKINKLRSFSPSLSISLLLPHIHIQERVEMRCKKNARKQLFHLNPSCWIIAK